MTRVGNGNSNLSISINDTNIVNRDSLLVGFTGKNTGETYAIISYSGKSDTIYFVVGGNSVNSGLKTWVGTIDDDWNKTGNWSPAGVPASTDDVIITNDAPVQPSVKVTGLSCNNIFICRGATVRINPGINLTTNGDIVIEGP